MEWMDGNPAVQMLDDGHGMNAARLTEAMRFGGSGPNIVRVEGDLGRFGLGLKTASLSQCRCLTVAARTGGTEARLQWDVDAVAASNAWTAHVPGAAPAGPLTDAFRRARSGVLVSWARMDPLGGLHGLDRDGFYERVREVRDHLAMTFHRFLDGTARRVSLVLNGRAVEAWDPFCRWHDATISMPRDIVRSHGATVAVRAFVLPHRDRFASDAEHAEAGGPGGWTERQGFYVYRGDRLVSPGGWLGLGGARKWSREESSRLARIAVDLPTSADAAWRIDIRKSMARPPADARARLSSAGAECRRRAREVFAWRGGGPRQAAGRAAAEPESIWDAGPADRRPRYLLRRGHPVVDVVRVALGSKAELLEGLLRVAELTVPVERIWLDVADEGGTTSTSDVDVEALAGPLAALVACMDSKLNPEVSLEMILRPMGVDSPALRRAVLALLEVR